MDHLSFIDDRNSEVFLMSIDLFSDAFLFLIDHVKRCVKTNKKNSALPC